MRNFEERMDEIRRRSGLILRNRRRRRKRLLVCVPVVLCVAALVGVIRMIPNRSPAAARMDAAPEFELLSDSVTLYSYEGSYDRHSDKNACLALPEENEHKNEAGYGYDAVMDDFTYGEVTASRSDQPEDTYSFQALGDNGTVTYYKLEGNLLTNTLTGEARELTQAQLEALLQLLEERGIQP